MVTMTVFIRNRLGKNRKVEALSAGKEHVLFNVSGSLYAMGDNSYCQLGIITEQYRYVPEMLYFNNDNDYIHSDDNDNNKKVTEVSCGDYHSLVLFDNGEVYSCGYLGKYETSRFKLVMSNVKNIKSSYESCTVYTNENKVYVWGENKHGQLIHNSSRQLSLRVPSLLGM